MGCFRPFSRSPEVSNGRHQAGIPGAAWLRRPLGRYGRQSAPWYQWRGQPQDPGGPHFHATPVARLWTGISTCHAATPCGLSPRRCVSRIWGRSVPQSFGRPPSKLLASNHRHRRDVGINGGNSRRNIRRRASLGWSGLVPPSQTDGAGFVLRIWGRLSAPPIINRSHNRTTPARAHSLAPRLPFRLPVPRVKVRAGGSRSSSRLVPARSSRRVVGQGNSRMDREGYLTNDVDRDHEPG